MVQLDTFPVSVKVAGRRIVVVGGGINALNKTRLVLRTSASVEVWARDFDPGFIDLPQERLTLNQRLRGLDPLSVGPHWLKGAALVFIADNGNDGEFAEMEARQAGVLVNVVDKPEACDFYTPSIVDRAPLSVAIMTEGTAPVIGRRTRAAIEAILSPELGVLATLCGSLREEIANRLPEGPPRRRAYEMLASSPEIAALLPHDIEAARMLALDLVSRAAPEAEPGAIAWVGAGPGAEDLLTLRAQRLLQSADVVVHDPAVPSTIIDLGRRDAERVVVDASTDTETLLTGLAAKGRRVVRLVAGDARSDAGVESEIAAARRAGIFTSLVPGIAAETEAAAQRRTRDRRRVA